VRSDKLPQPRWDQPLQDLDGCTQDLDDQWCLNADCGGPDESFAVGEPLQVA
jgi:hypothetical protein